MRRRALIVGGASGIGAATAEILSRDGIAVAVADLNVEPATECARGLAGDGHTGHAVDVGDEMSVVSLFETIEEAHGPVAIVVVAAGTPGLVEGKRPTLKSTPVESWDHVMHINTRGSFLCVREFLRRREQRPVEHGRAILIASMAAQNFAPNSPPAYATSKGAILALTKVAAVEAAAQGMTVNAVAPGPIDTPMLRGVLPADRHAASFGASIAGRPGQPAEVAAAIAFLASLGAAYINGACLDVNGGLMMR
jgi:3-oxoacyl-[acyl-carrier protein] reductase